MKEFIRRIHPVRKCVAAIALAAGCHPAPTPRPDETDPTEEETEVATEPPEISPPRNVLVVVLDDVSPWQLQAYAEHPSPAVTPTISHLASEGLLFQNFYAMPSCSPSRAAATTGRYGRRYDIGRWMYAEDTWELPLAEITLAEQLAQAPTPHSSHLIGKWHLATAASENYVNHPLLQGFATYRGNPSNFGAQVSYYEFPKVEADGSFTTSTTYATTDEVNDALEVITTTEGPFFVWLAVHAPHAPFHVAPADLRTTEVTEESSDGIKAFGAIEAVDAELARLLNGIDPIVLENTDVFLWADNGALEGVGVPPVEIVGGKGTVYEGGTRVPMIVWGPDVANPGTQTLALGNVADLFPTIAAIAGVDVDHEVDGLDLLPVIQGKSESVREYAYVESFYPNGPGAVLERDERAVSDVDWKLVHVLGFSPELYRLNQPLTDGPDYMLAPLEPDAQDAYDRLSAELARVEASLGIEALP